jgi:hypothetical protein
MQAPHVPDKAAIALLPLFPRLGLDRITGVSTGAQARAAQAQLLQTTAWGFDTESKPTFRVGETSDGPHILQLATAERAWVFQLHDPECRTVAAELLAQHGIVKAGFGLGDDRKRIVLAPVSPGHQCQERVSNSSSASAMSCPFSAKEPTHSPS